MRKHYRYFDSGSKLAALLGCLEDRAKSEVVKFYVGQNSGNGLGF